MSKLPVVSGNDAIAAFGKAGFSVARTEGSHRILEKAGHKLILTIPVHGSKPLKRGLLRSQIKKAGLTVDEFCELLK